MATIAAVGNTSRKYAICLSCICSVVEHNATSVENFNCNSGKQDQQETLGIIEQDLESHHWVCSQLCWQLLNCITKFHPFSKLVPNKIGDWSHWTATTSDA